MTKLIIYRLSDGLILRTVSCPTHMTAWQFDVATEGAIANVTLSNENYIIDGAPVFVIPPEAAAPTLEEAKTSRKAAIALARLAAEEGGIDFNGIHIDTDRVAQWQMASALITFRSGFVTSTQWKTNGQWVKITLPTLEAISAAVAQHVETCFFREKTLWDVIDACETVEAVEAVTWSME